MAIIAIFAGAAIRAVLVSAGGSPCLALLGPRNFFNLHPASPSNRPSGCRSTADVGFFWRLGHADGIYSLSGRLLLRSGRGSDARDVSTEFSLNVTWQIDPNMSLTGIYAHSVPGALRVFNDDVVASPRKPLRKLLWGCLL